LNDDLEPTFREWYPHFRPTSEQGSPCAIASHTF
jgi:hypothetical protein